MSLIVYRPGELVTLDCAIVIIAKQGLTLEGYQVQAITGLGSYRAVQEVCAWMAERRQVSISDLVAFVNKRNVIYGNVTLFVQCHCTQTHKPKAFAVSMLLDNPAVYATVGMDRVHSPFLWYVYKSGTQLGTYKPARLGGEPMCPFTYVACRCATFPDLLTTSMIHHSNGVDLKSVTAVSVLERFDNEARIARSIL
jgi:hypothetical protein